MPDIQNRSAFEGLFSYGIHGARRGQGVLIEAAPERVLILAKGNPKDTGFIAPIQKVLELKLPLVAGQTNDNGKIRVLWVGPDRWLVKAPCSTHSELVFKMSAAVPSSALNDVTHGRATLRLKGEDVRNILAAGCPLDLHPSHFKTGQCALTLLGHLNIIIDCFCNDTFEVTVTRSYAEELVNWITRNAGEYGYTIAPSA